MRFILTLVIGIALGIAAVWYFNHNKNNSQFETAGQEIKSTAQNAGNALADKFRSWKLDRETITNELARTGRVIREKTDAAGKALKDASADGSRDDRDQDQIRQGLGPFRLGYSCQHHRRCGDTFGLDRHPRTHRQSPWEWRSKPTARGRSSHTLQVKPKT